MTQDSLGAGDATRAEAAGRLATPALRAGDHVGRYLVLSTLGTGGMSVVYLAYDPELDRRVALKLMRAGGLGTLGRARLQREAQALARLSHPNVVPVYDVGTHADQTFMAMEHVEGETLRRWLKKPRPWREVVAVMRAAGAGLVAAHAAGIVHRDFKPDNVLIGKDGRVRVVDFGLARDVADLDGSHTPSSGSTPLHARVHTSRPMPVVDPEAAVAAAAAPGPEPAAGPAPAPGAGPAAAATAVGVVARPSARGLTPLRDVSIDDGPGDDHTMDTVDSFGPQRGSLEAVTRADHIVGTPAYMAPEQLRRGATDERADQFSFCVTFYEALYRQKPFGDRQVVAPTQVLTAAERPGAEPRQLALPPPAGSGVPSWLERVVLRGLVADPVHRHADMAELLAAIGRDPAVRWRRFAFAGAALAIVGLGLGLWMQRAAATRATCQGGPARFAEVWSDGARAEIDQAFARGGKGYAAASASAFGRGMDRYRDDWLTMHRDTCAATRVRGEQSEAVMDLRMACLEQRRAQAGALVQVMRHGDDEIVLGAGAAPEALPAIADCTDATLLATVARPRAPEAIARLEALRPRIDRVQALYAAGQAQAALDLSVPLVAELEPAVYPAAAAELAMARGRAAADLGRTDLSAAAFRDAFTLAMRARDDRLLVDAAARLAQEHLYAHELDAFRTWVAVARAGIDRAAGARRDMAAFLDQLECMELFWQGKSVSRLECLRAHAARVSDDRELSEWELSMLGLAAEEAGRPDEAITWLRRGVEHARRELGEDHPRTLEMRAYLCKGYTSLGEFALAEAECRDALVRLEAHAADQTALAARLRVYLGLALAALDRPDEARALLGKATDDETMRGEALNSIAAMDAKAKDWKSAAALAQESLNADLELLPAGHANVMIDRTLLAEALLASGDAAGAVTVLEAGLAVLDPSEIAGVTVAELRFVYARALWAADPARRPMAVGAARAAHADYTQRMPDTPRYRTSRDAVAAWLAAHAAP